MVKEKSSKITHKNNGLAGASRPGKKWTSFLKGKFPPCGPTTELSVGFPESLTQVGPANPIRNSSKVGQSKKTKPTSHFHANHGKDRLNFWHLVGGEPMCLLTVLL